MGEGYVLSCINCGYSFGANLGVGFAFPSVYRETIESAQKGELSEKLQKFVCEHPEGAVNCDIDIIYCTKCRKLKSGLNLNMYLPKAGHDPKHDTNVPWSIGMPYKNTAYATPWELKEHYKLFARYPHRCDSCGSPARAISLDTLHLKIKQGSLLCPCCGNAINNIVSPIYWD